MLASPEKITKEFVLPDDSTITLGDERFRCPELLFQPAPLLSKDPLQPIETTSIHQAIHNVIAKCKPRLQPDLYAQVLLSGGSTLFLGFAERLQAELTLLAPANMRVQVEAPPERKFGAWLGGSIFGALNGFQELWVSKQEFQESGAGIIHRKCL